MTAVWAILMVLLLVGADQLTKHLVLTHLADGHSVTVIPQVLQFRYVQNTGAAFSLFHDKTWLLSLVTAAILIAAAVLLIRGKIPGRFKQVCVLLIMAGGIGNLIDRVFRHYVVDFLEVLFVRFAVFNVADCFVTVGAFLLIFCLIVEMIREGKEEA